jgi:archaemetzincin
MKIGILQIGQFSSDVLVELKERLVKIFPDSVAYVIGEVLRIPEAAYDKKRGQYSSSRILDEVRVYAAKHSEFHRVLGVADVDIYTAGLNYVFGEAFTPGPAALISLHRLKPKFYGEDADKAVFSQRALKEAVHELGHTLGLGHCPRSLCVMHFSNSIFDTDKKQSLFCDQCYLEASIAITGIR